MTTDQQLSRIMREDYASWHKHPHEFAPTDGLHTGCRTCGYGPGAYFHRVPLSAPNTVNHPVEELLA